MIRFGSRVEALRLNRALSEHTDQLARTSERLSSGLRINTPSDDAAGLAVATSLQVRARVYNQAIRNVNDSISVISIADGALAQLTGIGIRLKELAEQAANGTYRAAQRNVLDLEADELAKEYTRILGSTSFNGQGIFDGSFENLVTQAGFGELERLTTKIGTTLGSGAGDGTFQQAVSLGLTVQSQGMVIGDFDADGMQDLVSVTTTSRIQYLRGLGNGTFAPPISYLHDGGTPDTLEARDLNGDGALDIIIGAKSNDAVIVYLNSNNGTGSFAGAVSYGTVDQPEGFAFGDLNGDGKTDLVVGSRNQTNFMTFMGAGGGTFSPGVTVIASGAGSKNPVLNDVNGDGKLDLIIALELDSEVGVALGVGDGTFGAMQDFAAGNLPSQIRSGDFTGDGKADILAYNFGGVEELRLLAGNGDGTFGAGVATGTTQGFMLAVDDFNSDGNLDYLTTNSGNTFFTIGLGNGNGTFAAPGSYAAPGSVEYGGYADFTGDGVKDLILTARQAPGRFYLFEGNRGTSNALQPLDLTTVAGARAALNETTRIIEALASERGNLGSYQSRLETAIANLSVSAENSSAAAGRILDADFAAESANLVRATVLRQTAAQIAAQINLVPELALKLLGR